MAADINASFFYISYDEPFADKHYSLLRLRVPQAQHLRGIKGVHNVVYKAAELSETTKFFVLDADGVLCSDFDISIPPEATEYSTIVWRARNGALGLEYGLGGLKLYDASDIDRQFGITSVAPALPATRKLFRKQYDGASGTRSLYLDKNSERELFQQIPAHGLAGCI